MNSRTKELAEQAGFDVEQTAYGEKVFVDGRGVTTELERFAELVRQDEREACAKFVEHEYMRQFEEPWRKNLATAIRGRSE